MSALKLALLRSRRALADGWPVLARARRATDERLAAWSTRLPFRAAIALACLAVQLIVATHSGDRFGVRAFNAAPGRPPTFRNPATDFAPTNWDRLVVARWDSGNYIDLGLRGYQYCPPRGPTLPVRVPSCNLAFYPTYGLLGRYLGRLTGMPIDFAMLAISLVSSFVFIFLWTGKELTERLGRLETYVALLCLNAFTTGYCLVTVQTEPLTLALAMGAFVAFARRRRLLGALLAGAASGMRVTGIAVGLGYAAGLLIELLHDRPRAVWPWVRALGLGLLCAWGQLALMAYHAYRFGDPLTYFHAHALLFHHQPHLGALFPPDPTWINLSFEFPLHEGLWLAAALLWFGIGHREALRRFPLGERAFWYVMFWATVGIATVGMLPISLSGMSRYVLLALPMFFAMGAVMRSRPLLLALWITMSAWHYWNVDICTYTGFMGDRTLKICHDEHWMKHH
ncbi:MAG TPA: hypothetical protein VHO06_20215 [Polyangia bacterium]|nr:hypothetical protein [Polyangia bacterium]